MLSCRRAAIAFVLAGLLAARCGAVLPAVPAPAGNPPTEAKRVLGKILFWEEQLSSDASMACGSCHRPASGGVDPRVGVHPGPDLLFGTPDDRLGSPGMRPHDAAGIPIEDPLFGVAPRVTARATPTIFAAPWADEIFWDGRAGGEFRDPRDGSLVLASGGALETQSIQPLLDPTEMAFPERDWDDVAAALGAATPLGLATDLPPDVAAALATAPDYPALFAEAFGDGGIDPVRIAFALATYMRSLVADDTPWDRFAAGDPSALTPEQQSGLAVFQNAGACIACHPAPHFSNQEFRATGVRPPAEDPGRQLVTGRLEDRNRFRVPSLRNVGLRPRFMHNGQKGSLEQALDFYARENGETQFPQNQDPHMAVVQIPEFGRANLLAFLRDGLTDPRVASESFPFDRPTLASERIAVALEPVAPAYLRVYPNPANPLVLFELDLGWDEAFVLDLFDARGRRVAARDFGLVPAGVHRLRFDAAALASGGYFYELRSPARRLRGRFSVVR